MKRVTVKFASGFILILACCGCSVAGPEKKAMDRFIQMKKSIVPEEVNSIVIHGRVANGSVRADENPALVKKFIDALMNARLVGPYEGGENALLTSTRDGEVKYVLNDQSEVVLEYYHGFGMTFTGADQEQRRSGRGTFFASQWQIYLDCPEIERLTGMLPAE